MEAQDFIAEAKWKKNMDYAYFMAGGRSFAVTIFIGIGAATLFGNVLFDHAIIVVVSLAALFFLQLILNGLCHASIEKREMKRHLRLLLAQKEREFCALKQVMKDRTLFDVLEVKLLKTTSEINAIKDAIWQLKSMKKV